MGKHAVRTRTQQKRLLQKVQHVVDRAGVGKGAEIFVTVLFFAAVFTKHRIFGLHVQRKIGEALVILEQNVVMRRQLFDQLVFQQQRPRLIFDDDKLHPFDFRHHPLQPNRQLFDMRIGHNPLFDVFRLADVKHLSTLAQHPVNTGLFGSNADVFLQYFQSAPDIDQIYSSLKN